jgi:hypothetical protein
VQRGLDDANRSELAISFDQLVATWKERIATSVGDFPNSGIRATPSKRSRWLERNVLKPSEKLLAALGDDNRPYLSDWGALYVNPEPLSDKKLQALADRLLELRAYADVLMHDLNSQIAEGAPTTGEMRYEIVFGLLQLFKKHRPKEDISRGTFDERWIGDLPEFVAASYFQITGERSQPRKGVYDLLRIAITE